MDPRGNTNPVFDKVPADKYVVDMGFVYRIMDQFQ